MRLNSCGVSSMNVVQQLPSMKVGWVSSEARKGDVGLDAADAELDQRAQDLPAGDLVRGAVAGALDEHRVVVGGDDGAGEAVTAVQPDAVAAGGPIDLDFARGPAGSPWPDPPW